MSSANQKPLFRALTAEDPEPEVTEIESLCMNCYKNVRTYLNLKASRRNYISYH